MVAAGPPDRDLHGLQQGGVVERLDEEGDSTGLERAGRTMLIDPPP